MLSKIIFHLKSLKIVHMPEFTFAIESTIGKDDDKELVKENDLNIK